MDRRLFACLLVLGCCGGDGQNDDEAELGTPNSVPQEMVSCGSPRGTYEITFTERSGNCGQQASMLVKLPDACMISLRSKCWKRRAFSAVCRARSSIPAADREWTDCDAS
jgi:hypothetical protein